MRLIVFRHLPAVAAIEDQLRLQSCGLLPDEEMEELPHLIDDASRELFGITANDTYYPALPEAVSAHYGRGERGARFEKPGQVAREPNTGWGRLGIGLSRAHGRGRHWPRVLGRPL